MASPTNTILPSAWIAMLVGDASTPPPKECAWRH
jgi:hypothetical protein